METRCSNAPMRTAPSAAGNRISRFRAMERMEWSSPREYRPAATRNQITLISAMGSPFSIAVGGYTLVSSQTTLTDARSGHPPICAGHSLLVLHPGGRVGALRDPGFADQ